MGKKGGRRVDSALRNPSYLRVANIIGISNLDSNNDVDAIEDYIKKNGDPFQNQLDAANAKIKEIGDKSIQDLRDLTVGFQDTIGKMNDDFAQRFKDQEDDSNRKFKSIQDAADRRYDDLNDILVGRTNDFNNTLDDLNDQLTKSNDALVSTQGALDDSLLNARNIQGLLDDTVRLSTNQANAFVPAANPGARTAVAGDDRRSLFNNVRPKAKQLNDLTLLSGVGSQGNPLAGLQIA